MSERTPLSDADRLPLPPPAEREPEPMAELREMVAWLDRHRKTVLCPPGMVDQVQALIDRCSPQAGLYEVHPSELTDGHIYVIDSSVVEFGGS